MHFARVSFSRNFVEADFRENKPSRKYLNLQYLCDIELVQRYTRADDGVLGANWYTNVLTG